MKMEPSVLQLYAVSDRAWLRGETLEAQIGQILAAGATCLQLREKCLAYEDYLAEARRILPICRRYGVPLIINDNVALALAAGADGVHVGQGDMDVSRARALLGEDKILGVTAHNVAEALTAVRNGADYLGCGAVFGSTTKNNTVPLSYEELRRICSAVDVPVVAIGGIGRENILKLKGTGIAGVAVVSALFAARDKAAATAEMLKLSREVAGCIQP